MTSLGSPVDTSGFTGPVVLPQTPPSTVSTVWGNQSGRVAYGAVGRKDVLLIESEEGLSHRNVVPRRPAIELTEELRKDLEDQGIAREKQQDDITIMKARRHLNEYISTIKVVKSELGKTLTKKDLLQEIAILMKMYDDEKGGGMCCVC